MHRVLVESPRAHPSEYGTSEMHTRTSPNTLRVCTNDSYTLHIRVHVCTWHSAKDFIALNFQSCSLSALLLMPLLHTGTHTHTYSVFRAMHARVRVAPANRSGSPHSASAVLFCNLNLCNILFDEQRRRRRRRRRRVPVTAMFMAV